MVEGVRPDNERVEVINEFWKPYIDHRHGMCFTFDPSLHGFELLSSTYSIGLDRQETLSLIIEFQVINTF